MNHCLCAPALFLPPTMHIRVHWSWFGGCHSNYSIYQWMNNKLKDVSDHVRDLGLDKFRVWIISSRSNRLVMMCCLQRLSEHWYLILFCSAFCHLNTMYFLIQLGKLKAKWIHVDKLKISFNFWNKPSPSLKNLPRYTLELVVTVLWLSCNSWKVASLKALKIISLT
jgi:hypothetical protein